MPQLRARAVSAVELDALVELHEILGPQLYIHLKGGPKENTGSSSVSHLLHSKVIWIKKGDRHVSIFVGSHNWTGHALNGVNLEASTRIDCERGETFEQAVKTHINACIKECDVFNPDDLDYYRSLQVALFPKRPRGPERQPLRHFEKADGTVIHAEDHWRDGKPDELVLYLPLDDARYNKWFKSEPPTTLFLYLYPPGSLTASGPPTATPELYQGEIRTHSRDAVTRPVNCQIPDLTLPKLTPVPSGSIPERPPGVVAQAVGTFRHVRVAALPVYVQGHRPSVQVEPNFAEEAEETPFPALAHQAPVTLRHYFTPESIRDGFFVFLDPMPHYSVTMKIPGRHLYPIPPEQMIRPILERPDRTVGVDDAWEVESGSKLRRQGFRDIDILVDDANEGMRYVYPVTFVFVAHE